MLSRAPLLLALSVVSLAAAGGAANGGCSRFDAEDGAGAPDAGDEVSSLCAGGCPVAAWSFDEIDGPLLKDSSGHGNDGLLGTARRVPGQVNGALAFESSATTVQASALDTPSLDVQGTRLSVTFWAWLPPAASGANDQVLFAKPWIDGKKGDPLFYQFGVEWNPADSRTLDFILGDLAAGKAQVASVLAPDSTWLHVAFVYDGTLVLAFLDGAPAGTTPMTTVITARGTALRFGADALLEQRFGGKLDEVRIYDRALSPAEVRSLARR
jgi:hypothetical protein